jgi:cytochrome d ubiquinol oxidase subunit II
MLPIVLIFLGLSLLLYLLFGGADFGAGILELFSKPLHRGRTGRITYSAIGPVWEANHIWLIIMIVILFNGFPELYTTLSTYLFIPMVLLLIGIVIRGTAFAFRHYDAVKDGSQKYYAWMFMISSLLTPFFIGVIAGAMILGRIDPNAPTYAGKFLDPWLNSFSMAMGLFTCSIFSFLAAVFLIGETSNMGFRGIFLRKARNANIATIISGGLVFLSAWANGLPLVWGMMGDPLSLGAIVLATLSLPVLWYALNKAWVMLPRLIAGFQIVMILFAWLWTQYPVIIRTEGQGNLTLFNTAAPESTIYVLGIALLVAGALVIPALLYLLIAFKWNKGLED